MTPLAVQIRLQGARLMSFTRSGPAERSMNMFQRRILMIGLATTFVVSAQTANKEGRQMAKEALKTAGSVVVGNAIGGIAGKLITPTPLGAIGSGLLKSTPTVDTQTEMKQRDQAIRENEQKKTSNPSQRPFPVGNCLLCVSPDFYQTPGKSNTAAPPRQTINPYGANNQTQTKRNPYAN
jgi:hypothetical protein